MPGLQIGGLRAIGDAYWQEYDSSVERFREESKENILEYLETRSLLERIATYIPLSKSNARKRAAKDTLKEKL